MRIHTCEQLLDFTAELLNGRVSIALFSCTFRSITSEKGQWKHQNKKKKSDLQKDSLEAVFDKLGDGNTFGKVSCVYASDGATPVSL